MPNKSTTLRESWKEEFREYFDKNLKPKKPTMKNLDREIIVDFISKLLTSHNTELVSKIEGMWNYPCDCERKNILCIHDFTTMHAVISIINQDK